jgi:hypothetical protein
MEAEMVRQAFIDNGNTREHLDHVFAMKLNTLVRNLTR